MSINPQLSLIDINEELKKENHRESQLTVLSYGGGQDSTALLYKLVFDIQFRKTYAPNDLLVVFCNTGNEHKETYEHVEEIKIFCKKYGVEFVEVEKRFHGTGWSTLTEQFERNTRITSKAFPSTCSVRLKIDPFYNFLEEHISKKYNVPYGRKKGFKSFASQYKKINVLIGFAKGEEGRCETKEFTQVWKRMAIRQLYPLIELGMDRYDCHKYIQSLGFKLCPPSNCMFCHWASLQELLWLYRFRRDYWNQWVQYEKNKLNADEARGVEKNVGVSGEWDKVKKTAITLTDKINEAIEKYGDWSDEKLQEYKMSHGHCVASKF